MPETVIVLMAKYPEAGRVKTRLAATIGEPAAFEVYENLLADIVGKIISLDSTRFTRVAAVSPATACAQFGVGWPGLDQVIPQAEGDLGVRMRSVIEHFTDQPAGHSCILVGADIPLLDQTLIGEAADQLKSADLVLGPTIDGGYYLIGMNRVCPELFEGIEWGTSSVLEQTVAKGMLNRLDISTLKPLRDLDDLDDLNFFRSLKLRI